MGPREVMSCFSYICYTPICIFIYWENELNNDISWISNKLLEYKYIYEEEILREMYLSQLVSVFWGNLNGNILFINFFLLSEVTLDNLLLKFSAL